MKMQRPTTKPSNGFLAGIGLPPRGQPLINAVKTGPSSTHFKRIAVLMGCVPVKAWSVSGHIELNLLSPT